MCAYSKHLKQQKKISVIIGNITFLKIETFENIIIKINGLNHKPIISYENTFTAHYNKMSGRRNHFCTTKLLTNYHFNA